MGLSLGFVVTSILGLAFPVQVQTEFVQSNTRESALQLKEDYLYGSEIVRDVEDFEGKDPMTHVAEVDRDSEAKV